MPSAIIGLEFETECISVFANKDESSVELETSTIPLPGATGVVLDGTTLTFPSNYKGQLPQVGDKVVVTVRVKP